MLRKFITLQFPSPLQFQLHLTTMTSLCFAFRVLFLLSILFSSSSHSFRDDRRPLLAFKKLITNDPNHSMANWISANPLCNWTGVTCTRRHPQHNRVVALNLTFMDLGGSISPFLGNLSFLRILDLSDNVLHGHIQLNWDVSFV